LAQIDKTSSLVFAEPFFKKQDLLEYRNQKILNTNTYINGLRPLSKVKKSYPFFIYKKFNLQPDITYRILPYLDYISIKDVYDDEKLNLCKNIKLSLLDNQIYKAFDFSNYKQIYALNGSFVPAFLTNVETIYKRNPLDKAIDLYETDNPQEQVYAVFERVVDILESGKNINQIKIVNANEDDYYQLSKLFLDAGISTYHNKQTSIKSHPLYKKVKDYFLSHSLIETKSYIEDLSKNHPSLAYPLIQCFNSYLDKDIENFKDVFIYEMDRLSLKEKRPLNVIDFIDLDQMYHKDEIYLMMNYTDESIPKKDIDNDFLSNHQKSMIHYPTSEQINQYRKNIVSFLLDELDVILFYPRETVTEMRPASLDINRPIQVHQYKYRVKEVSYLKNDDFLRYASLKDLAENYHIIKDDYPRLKSQYSNHKTFTHQFKGINKDDLNYLLDRKYTLTGKKIEMLNLCPFQYFLTNLLNFDEFTDNHYIYFGNMLHKALESVIKDPTFDYEAMVHRSEDFPVDIIYKKDIFNEILLENIQYMIDLVQSFHNDSGYKKIMTEWPFSKKRKDQDRFLMTGIIDKVMINDKTNHYIIIDYKYSKHDFSIDDMKKGRKLQLPFYYLIFDEAFDLNVSGIFYRQTGLNRMKKIDDSDYRLNGVFLDDLDQMKALDPDGLHIKSLRYTKTGMFNYKSKISQSDFDDMKTLMNHMVDQAAKQIEAGNFQIKPILNEEVGKTSISCVYCPHASICYSKNKRLEEVEADEIHTITE
jgi:hypothetical protein